MRGGKGAGVPLLLLLAASLDMGSTFPALSTCTGGEASSPRSPFSPVLSLSCEFCRLLLGPSALFSGEGVISGPSGKEAHDFGFLLLESSLPPCITLALLQIGHPKPLALLQALLDQVERPGEEADIGGQGGKPPPASSLEAEVPTRTEQLGWRTFPSQPWELSAHRADGTRRLRVPGAGAGAAFAGQIQHTAAG